MKVKLLLPKQPITDNPLVTILIPVKNEALTIVECIEWCRIGLQRAGVKGQILIVDSSTDSTGLQALQQGAEVLRVDARGLGRAYIAAIPYVRGELVIMGDADLTYDFREISAFICKYRAGYDLIMGSRLKGKIEKNAMPLLHRYLGTPLTTWLLNKLYRANFSDINCGLRAISYKGLCQLQLSSPSWQYASEMLVKALKLKLNYTEIPIVFYKDRPGRVSHFKRGGFLTPWYAGWLNLKMIVVGRC